MPERTQFLCWLAISNPALRAHTPTARAESAPISGESHEFQPQVTLFSRLAMAFNSRLAFVGSHARRSKGCQLKVAAAMCSENPVYAFSTALWDQWRDVINTTEFSWDNVVPCSRKAGFVNLFRE